MDVLKNKVLYTINKYRMFESGDKVVVGLSGGADSCVLLDVLHSLSSEINITLYAAHLNHGIRGEEAKRDMVFSEKFAQERNIKFICKTVDTPAYASLCKVSEEMAGRKLRYDFFEHVCQKYNCNKIAVAHNRNDRVETVLLNIIRGCGLNGLGGIKPVNNKVCRPLIDVSRAEIEEYASDKRINYITDSTNLTNDYSRNIIRNSVLPYLKQINSSADDNIIRCSDICILEDKFISQITRDQITLNGDGNSVEVNKELFISCTKEHKKHIILEMTKILNDSTVNLSFSQLEIASNLNTTGTKFMFSNGFTLVVENEKIILTKEVKNINPYEYKITVNNICHVEEIGKTYLIEEVSSINKDNNSLFISADNININNLKIRSRKDGDVFQPYGLSGTKKLKKFFIDEKIPVQKRNSYPLFVCDDEILAVYPIRINDKYKVTAKTKSIFKISEITGNEKQD